MDKEYIEFIRFESNKNKLINQDASLIQQINATKRSLLASSLRVSQETVPCLYRQIEACSKILDIDLCKIDVYVYSTPDHNAFSISQMDANILIGVSSSLIKILDSSELRFLIGHELGHAILGHSESTHLSTGKIDYHHLKNIRHMEISADRIGYLCSMSIDKSITSMMKIASGLHGELLTKDIRPFINQSIDIGDLIEANTGDYSKHLPLPIRARALVWLSTIKLFDNSGVITDLKKEHHENIRSINQQINNMVSTILDKQRNKSFEKHLDFFKLILYTWHYSIDGSIRKADQTHLIQLFGDNAKKIFSLMNGSTKVAVSEMLERKLKYTFNDMLYYSRDISLKYLQDCCESLDIAVDKVKEMVNPVAFERQSNKEGKDI